jgi:hypothetical protein
MSTSSTPKAVPTLWLEEVMMRENMGVGGLDVHGLSYRGTTGVGVIKPFGSFEVENVPTGQAMPPEPMFTLTHKAAQALFDALYKQGFRPSSGEATESHKAELAAVRAHLNDMRLLALRTIEASPEIELKLEEIKTW